MVKEFKLGLFADPGPIPAFIRSFLSGISEIEGVQVCLVRTEKTVKTRPSSADTLLTLDGNAKLAYPADPGLVSTYLLQTNGNFINAEGEKEFVDFDLVMNFGSYSHTLPGITGTPVIHCSLFSHARSGLFPMICKILAHRIDCFGIHFYSKNGNGSALVWKEGWYKTAVHSYVRTTQMALDGALHLAIEIVKQFQKGILKSTVVNDINFETSRNYSADALSAMLSSIFRHRINNLFTNIKWNYGIIPLPISAFLNPEKKSYTADWMQEANDTDFMADPFGFIYKNERYIAYEYYDATSKKGVIRLNVSSSDHVPDETILSAEVHLSYPMLFEAEGNWYCIPEQYKSNKVDLYKFDPENKKLLFEQTLIENFAGVDNTIVYYQGKWWIFCTDGNSKGSDLRLHLYFADHFRGPWKAHQMNPVKTDVRSARSGGTPFYHENKLYRPAQDSSKGYGSAIAIMEIVQLTEDIFEEKLVNRITPEQFGEAYNEGIHTLSSIGEFTLIDGKRKVYTRRNFFTRMRTT